MLLVSIPNPSATTVAAITAGFEGGPTVGLDGPAEPPAGAPAVTGLPGTASSALRSNGATQVTLVEMPSLEVKTENPENPLYSKTMVCDKVTQIILDNY